jgi:ubiquinone/menaquinone biosynthesis C-methylase UbiE
MQYLHGFDSVEQNRLVAQAHVLKDKIFENIDFSSAKNILEVGCGVGAQTEILLNLYPTAKVTGIELSEIQLNTAKHYLQTKFDSSRYELFNMNAETMDFAENTFDAIYVCWVLEHVANPQKVVDECFRVLKKGGVVYISEVQNNNLYLYPKAEYTEKYWEKYNNLQLEMGGNPFVGAQIGNLLFNAKFSTVNVKSKTFLYDNSTPEKREIMADYWCDLLLSGFSNLLLHNKVEENDKETIKQEMNRVKQQNGAFHYSFIQGYAVK